MEELKRILKKNRIKGKEFAEEMGLSLDHYYRCSMPTSDKRPNWIKSFLIGYELGLKNGKDENND